MSLLLRLSFRNLWRNKRRTLITVSAMAFATALLILTMGLMEGVVRDSLESATGLYHGHAKITAPRYLAERDMNLTMPQIGPVARLTDSPHVRGVAGRVRGYTLLSCGRENASETQPAELLGIEPSEEERVSGLSHRIKSGENLHGDATNQILLGTTLAERLGAKVGSEIVAMGQGADGSVAPGLFRVSGLIDCGDTSLNGSLALVGRKTLQDMLGLPGQLHEWVVALDDPMQAPAWALSTTKTLPGLEVTSWHGMLPALASMVDMIGVSKIFTAVVFYFGVVLVTVNTMYMAQLERLREFAVMGAIGLRPRRLMALIVLEGTVMSMIAAALGGVIGASLNFYMSTHPVAFSSSTSSISMAGATMQTVMRTIPTWDGLLWPILLMMVLGGLISFFPAWKLGRLRPVDALREV